MCTGVSIHQLLPFVASCLIFSHVPSLEGLNLFRFNRKALPLFQQGIRLIVTPGQMWTVSKNGAKNFSFSNTDATGSVSITLQPIKKTIISFANHILLPGNLNFLNRLPAFLNQECMLLVISPPTDTHSPTQTTVFCTGSAPCQLLETEGNGHIAFEFSQTSPWV